MSRNPQVVAIVINYNYGRFLHDCLSSIEAQTYSNLRIVLVDDASTDESHEVIDHWQSWTKRNITVVRKSENLGPGHSYNIAMSLVSPQDDYVAMIDSDDTWLPDKLTTQVAALEGFPAQSSVLLYSDSEHVDARLGEPRVVYARPIAAGSSAAESTLEHGSPMALNASLVRAEAFRQMGEIDPNLRLCDLQVWLKLSRLGEFSYLPGVVCQVRAHEQSMSRTERLASERLRLLGRHSFTRSQRHSARLRGREQMRILAISRTRAPLNAYLEYALGTHDLAAVPFVLIRFIPGGSALVRILRRVRVSVSNRG